MLKKIIIYTPAIVILLFTADILLCFVYPDISALKKENPKKTSFMEYREKEWAEQGLEKEITRKWVPLKKISPYVIKAVIIAEDDKFWKHDGFDYAAMEQALKKDIRKREFKAGGSTISQQLAKNLFLTPAKNPVRKIKEAIYTWRLEHALSKKRIVEIYLNVAEWGDGIFGIEAAARHHYGKHASALTAEEAARLASVLPNPRKFIPSGNSKYVRYRSAGIYRIMVQRGIIIPEYEEVMNAPDESPAETASTDAAEVTSSGIVPPPDSGDQSDDSMHGTEPGTDLPPAATDQNPDPQGSQESPENTWNSGQVDSLPLQIPRP
jgi:monofunctional biosynthetic peptidoglycan transglycosylase